VSHSPPMREHVSLVGPPIDSPRGIGTTSPLPPDLLRQVRQRVRTIALLMLAAFAVDPLIYFVGLALGTLDVVVLPREFQDKALFAWVSVGAAVASAMLWRAAASPRLSPAQLLNVGFVYQVALCVAIAWMTYLQT